MNEIRPLFHAVNNMLHKALIHAGVLRVNMKENEGALKGLEIIEKSLLAAAGDLEKIKSAVYKELGIDPTGEAKTRTEL
jgi:hypothetical protein